MSQPNSNDENPGRKAWRDGSLDPKSGEFEQYAARGRELLGSAEEADELLADLDAALDEFAIKDTPESADSQDENARPAQKGAVVRPMRRWLAMVAAIALLLTAGWWLMQDSGDLLDQHFAHYDSNVAVRTLGGPASTDADEFANVMAAYDRKDYAKAIPALEAYFAAHAEDERRYFFLGVSYLGNHQAEKALPLLAEARNNSAMNEAATFYWALAAKSLGPSQEADDALVAIADRGGIFAERAHRLRNGL